uniref:Phosphatase PAP2 family protein n=1 Tax=Roseihalotalea indica TaxID=2867963 RepID=A0AA49JDL9_9BACT|nr:phosphatase PAP2 family protein [Tunicatimonas sp. TK19036]
MIEAIQEADQQWFLWLNSFHTPSLDILMSWVTNKYTWIPFYVLLGVSLIYKFGWEGVRMCLLIGLVIAFCDQLTSGFMKPFFERLRPCHNPDLESVIYLVEGCGGKYGFASSHAANAFGLATVCWLLLRHWSTYFAWGFLWATVVSYSRIYMGVHYPLDVIVGAVIGIMGAILLYLLYRKFMPYLIQKLPQAYP